MFELVLFGANTSYTKGGIEKGLDFVGQVQALSQIRKNCPGGEAWGWRGSLVAQAPRWWCPWVLRVMVHGRRREMGLGSLSNVALNDARNEADRWRAMAEQGIDPIKKRASIAREQVRGDNTLRKVAEEAFEARKAELKGDGKAGRWFSPLELHVLPKLGRVPIEEIDQRDIRDILVPSGTQKRIRRARR